MKGHILLIDDEQQMLRTLSLFLTDQGHTVTTAQDGREGIEKVKSDPPDVVVSDIKIRSIDGMMVLQFCRLNYPNIPIIFLTAFGSVETAVAAMKYGAYDFLTKPVDHQSLLETIEQALIHSSKAYPIDAFIGTSAEMKKVKKNIRLFASTDSSVLIMGESGTGKELAARAIYRASARKGGPFVKVNCAAIPRELIESELFGHKKGAFTGALQDRIGAFREADRGVLFLDEIGDLPIELQPKLLWAVEEKTVTPIGSDKTVPVSVKILSATNRNLATMVKESQFRMDLYYRLNTVHLNLPALRHKKEDIRELVRFFSDKYCREFKKPQLQIPDSVMTTLIEYSWPGNVRELKNFIEHAVIICRKTTLTLEHFPDHIRQSTNGGPNIPIENPLLNLAVQEQKLLLAALEKHHWHQCKTARELGITRSALRYRVQKYGIKRP